jgi:hypothetical protein
MIAKSPDATPMPKESFIGRGIYSIPDAAQLIGLNAARVRRWTTGYEWKYRGAVRWSPPIVGHVERNARAASSLSFRDLIEVLHLIISSTKEQRSR